MKRHLLSFLTILTLILTLTGCSNTRDVKTPYKAQYHALVERYNESSSINERAALKQKIEESKNKNLDGFKK